MTEETAKAALDWAAKKMGGKWRVVDGSVCKSRAFGERDGEDTARKRFRLEYGEGEYVITFCHGDTWREALDDYVAACRWPGWRLPGEFEADSAEELVLKLAAAGEIQETPRRKT